MNNNKNKITKNNIQPFISNKILNKNIIGNLLSNDEAKKPLPLIPGFEFYENDNIGSKIINNYYKIKTSIDNLTTIKNFICDIVEVNKDELEKINIKKESYNISDKNNLIITFNNNINNTFTKNNTFDSFFDNYIKNNKNFIKKNNSDIPLFIKIFQENYSKVEVDLKKKTYYMNLFKQYTTLRENLLTNYLSQMKDGKQEYKNTGILSYDCIFNILKKNKTKNINSTLNSSSKNNINYSKIKIRGTLKRNNNSNNFKIGDIVKFNGKNGTIKNIDYKNHFNKPYKIIYNEDGVKKNIYLNKTNIKINNKKFKNTLSNKIDLYTRLYDPILSKDYFITKFKKNLDEIYNNLYESINNLFSNNNEPNLLNIIKYYIEVDFNIIKLIFYYVDTITFKKSIINHYEILDNIMKKINVLQNVYPSFVGWYNILIGSTKNMSHDNFNINSSISDFETYYNSMLKKIID